MFDEFFADKEEERDNLTFLYRRHVILEYMQHLINEGTPFSFIMLDVDNFKHINDTYGHLMGDEVLRAVAASLLKYTKGKGVVGRYGGDEFMFIYPNVNEYNDIWQIGFETLKTAKEIDVNGQDILISYTMGISRFPIDSTSIDDLINTADKALYRGKVKGRNCFIIYLPEKHANIALQTMREKVYSPVDLHCRIHTMLTTKSDILSNIKKTINFIGPYLMIDHFCIETKKDLIFEYNHPIAPDKSFEPYGFERIEAMLSNFGILIENTVMTSKHVNSDNVISDMNRQGVYSAVLIQISAFGNVYGYLRAEMTATDTGRIWQNEDLVLLSDFATEIGLLLYAKGIELK